MTRAGPATVDALSPRQLEVVELLAKGLSNEDVAGVLGISRATVRTHVASILAALDVANRAEAAAVYTSWAGRPRQIAEVIARPAIAVLPPLALDDDAPALTTASGLGHDLAALFARWCWFPVIAQSSVRAARGLGGLDCRAMGRALGARFVVDGTLRRGPVGWRLVVEVADVEDAASLWTETYDFSGEALFEVQDAVVASVVAAAYPMLVQRAALARRASAGTRDLAAWELAHEGMRLESRREPGLAEAALACFDRALELDETLVLAHFGRGLCAYDAILNQWGDTAAAADRLADAAARCLDLASHGAEGDYLLGRHHQTRGDHPSAVRVLETAVGKNPSFAPAHALLAQALHLSGRSEEGLERMRHALRLGPRSFVAGLATLHFARREYAEALDAAERAIAIAPRYTYARALAAAAAHWLGQRARARSHAGALRRDYPPFETRGFLTTFGPEVEAVAAIHHALIALTSS